MHTIDFQPVGRHGKCPDQMSLLECGRRLNVDIVSICGGMGTCGQCKVQIVSGQVSARAPDEGLTLTEKELTRNYRLACRTYPQGDVKVHVPPESLTAPQRTQVEGLELDVAPDPLFQAYDAALRPPSLARPESDEENLRTALSEQHGIGVETLDIRVLRDLSPRLREHGWQASVVVREKEVVAVGPCGARWLGTAVDIGTTKIAVYLVDMQTGETLAARGMMNPQISYGEDVVSRIHAAGKDRCNAEKLQELLVEALNDTSGALCAEIGAAPTAIVEAVVVGNTAIHHMFLGLPVRQLGMAPYIPALRSDIDIKARDLGLVMAPGGYVHLLPNVAGYCGADHVAMLLATRISEMDGVSLAIDIGTNTEICLNNRGRMASVSCASGPAFEGAHMRHGMRAAPGAIERVRLSGERLDLQTIGGKPPIGICGSGLLDVAAQLRLNGALDASGKLQDHPRVRIRDGSRELVLAEIPGKDPITVSQRDIRELQVAKAAIRLGIRALLEAEGLEASALDRVIIAGAFGTFIDVQSAVTVGMLPSLPQERFSQVGNAAGSGARLALISSSQRQTARKIALQDRYLELGSISGFSRKFAEACAMGNQ